MIMNYSKEVMLKVVKEKPGLGKTAIMKIMFILQQVFALNLGYEFEIYTYGPYSAEVTDDMETLIQEAYIDADVFSYKNSIAYKLNICEKGAKCFEQLGEEEERKIAEVLKLFGDKNAKELELDSTIIYMKNLYKRNNWQGSIRDIASDVHEIKPHFTIETIEKAYKKLTGCGVITSE